MTGALKRNEQLLTLVQVAETSLVPQDEHTADEDVDADGDRAGPPDDGVTDEVDLSMVLDPEVLNRQLGLSSSQQ